ncbi:MAG: group 1 truncated hemoglobin [Zetaproteobacteria bacterium]|nr:MAG: group 1 truncated hemoglobin [Zetaproteobacteria bacterium]
MHFDTFIPAFLIFAVVGLVLPVLLATIADAQRTSPEEAEPAPQSLYDRLGGEAAVNAAVDIFYRKVLADPFVTPFFEGVDMAKQAAKQKAFLTLAFGGPNRYTGKDMREGHRHLVKRGLNDAHFDHILVHLRSTLAELGVPDPLIQEAAAIAESTRNDVLDR